MLDGNVAPAPAQRPKKLIIIRASTIAHLDTLSDTDASYARGCVSVIQLTKALATFQHISAKRMGGYNSGGHNAKGRLLVEQCPYLRIRDLHRAGVLLGRRSCELSFNGKSLFHLEAVSGDCLQLRNTNSSFSSFIAFEIVPRHFGGGQAYFKCGCGTRCTTLQLALGRLRCRSCHQLTYRSQRLRPLDRGMWKVEKVQKRLMGFADFGFGVPPKPKHMHWKRYYRETACFEEAETLWNSEMLRRFGCGHASRLAGR